MLKKKKNRNFRIVILFLILIFFSVIATEIAYVLFKVKYVKVITAKLEVGDVASFALGGEKFDIINFGTISQGGGGKRFLTIENQKQGGLFVHIIAAGKIRDFISYENNFVVKVNETKKLEFTIFVPEDAERGKYSGKFLMIFKKA